jgi:predicted RNA-binding protein YlxR (DUF448 family)
MRSCVICREKQPKRDLLRIVRTPEGEVRVDPSGKMNGRGGYVCADGRHWGEKQIRARLEQALKASLSQQDIDRLSETAAQDLAVGPKPDS